MDYKYIFTIFTATYNRGHFLSRIYDSLISQTLQNFEWIIIDDGSSDNTNQIVRSLISRNSISIDYFFQENSGKHTCYDIALKHAQGEFFLPLDSDDIPKVDALEKLYNAYNQIPDIDKSKFSAVTGLCVFDDNTIIGNRFPKNIFDSTPLDMLFKHNLKGDKWGFQKTAIRKQYLFDYYKNKEIIKNIKYYPEITVFGEIGRKYKTRYINEPLKIVEYMQDGISKSKIIHAIPKKISALYKLKSCIDYLKNSPKQFILAAILYIRWSLHSSTFNLSELGNYKAKALVVLLFPIGFLVFLYEKYKY